MNKEMERYRSDPEFRERFALLEREKARRKREKVMADPEKHAKALLKRKLRHARQVADPAERERLNAKRRKGLIRRRPARPATPTAKTNPLEALRRALHRNELWASVLAATPVKYRTEVREDIASEAVVALLEGVAKTPEDAVKIGRQRLGRATSSFGLISIDQPRMNGGSWHDVLPAREVEAFATRSSM